MNCARCGDPVPEPSYALSEARRARRLCGGCRSAVARENGVVVSTQNATISMSREARQVVLASVSGDGHLEKPPRERGNYGLAIKHAMKQEEYLRWKAGLLGPLVRKLDYPADQVRVRTVRHPDFTALAARVREHGKMHVLPDLDALGWAVLYMDDGNYTGPDKRGSKPCVRIALPPVTDQEWEYAACALAVFAGVQVTRATWRNPRKPEAPYWGLRLYGDQTEKFLKRVRGFCEAAGMSYKAP